MQRKGGQYDIIVMGLSLGGMGRGLGDRQCASGRGIAALWLCGNHVVARGYSGVIMWRIAAWRRGFVGISGVMR